ncbi:hypothetical protein J2T57_001499 [Natronocella acetinitrilica]|uniref:Uncharacterized protein n=1 Tax=Natronocella acetinitrilica TaxID=414046 RepID=A0AAE3G5T2_9GAMM|nr:hypothetical protein [Natronocella acetinitrilica]MCP1674397.1 hypothetical protein [Natronocella acetinitrilica]
MHNLYLGRCVGLTAEAVEAMVDQARTVSAETFRRRLGAAAYRALEAALGYDHHLRLADDYAVEFFRSRFAGVTCYYLEHSRIEYVLVETLPGVVSRGYDGDDPLGCYLAERLADA